MTATTDDRAALVAALAQFIRERGLIAPATLLLELSKPLGFLGGQLLVMLGPLVSTAPHGRFDQFAALLEDRQAVEQLLAAIGSRSAPTAD
mgnify:FL=1